jgi:hypothetical protein
MNFQVKPKQISEKLTFIMFGLKNLFIFRFIDIVFQECFIFKSSEKRYKVQ